MISSPETACTCLLNRGPLFGEVLFMNEIIKEEIFYTVKKKRFIVLAALAILGIPVITLMTKNNYWNDLTYYLAIQKYLFYVFGPAVGTALIISVYRKKYTRNSIIQVEEFKVKRPVGVLARVISGAIILAVCYAVAMLVVLLLGLIFGANLSIVQTGELALRMAMDCLGCIVTYSAALFWLFLFAFPIVSVLVYLVLMIAVPYVYQFFNLYVYGYYKYVCYFVPKALTDHIYSNLVLKNMNWLNALILLLQIAVYYLLTILVFKFKKKDKKKRKKKSQPEETETVVNTAPAPAEAGA